MRSINTISLLVHDYDEAIAFYIRKLGFSLLEDSALGDDGKRWVLISPGGGSSEPASSGRGGGATLLLARASGEKQIQAVGNQAGGRVMFFLHTDDFWQDYQAMSKAGVIFNEEPREEVYGTIAVFQDLYGNLWDLIQPA
ncbi:VOC family protein [Granulosicoccus sp. 3-233]|uniref:VOC family protein n=1 Tax=Granulosicoccus sp. 3-233 TaxID=3417969 RepID=UPI003D34DC13